MPFLTRWSDQLAVCPLGADCRVCWQVAPIWGIAGVTSWTNRVQGKSWFYCRSRRHPWHGQQPYTPSFLPLHNKWTQSHDALASVRTGDVVAPQRRMISYREFRNSGVGGLLDVTHREMEGRSCPQHRQENNNGSDWSHGRPFLSDRNVTYFRSRTRNKTLKTFA